MCTAPHICIAACLSVFYVLFLVVTTVKSSANSHVFHLYDDRPHLTVTTRNQTKE